jgi:hypothetical protein
LLFCKKLLKSSIFELQNHNLHQKKANFFHYCQNNVQYCSLTSQALKCTAHTHITSYYQSGFSTHIATCYHTSHLRKLQPNIASLALKNTDPCLIQMIKASALLFTNNKPNHSVNTSFVLLVMWILVTFDEMKRVYMSNYGQPINWEQIQLFARPVSKY